MNINNQFIYHTYAFKTSYEFNSGFIEISKNLARYRSLKIY